MRWAPDGASIYFDADSSGARNVQIASIVGGVKPLTSGRQMLSFDSMSKDLVAAGVSSDLNTPPDELWPGKVVNAGWFDEYWQWPKK